MRITIHDPEYRGAKGRACRPLRLPSRAWDADAMMRSMKAIQVQTAGGPDQMHMVDVPDPRIGPDQVRVDVAACGVNFIDTYQRSGIYDVDLPFTPGLEGAGVVSEVGPEVDWAAPGDRLAWAFT